jgi:hypothetical protein
MKIASPMKTIATKVLVVGGPGGYVAAIRTGQLGLDMTLVEGVALAEHASCAAASLRRR